jgi:hypothetical protein
MVRSDARVVHASVVRRASVPPWFGSVRWVAAGGACPRRESGFDTARRVAYLDSLRLLMVAVIIAATRGGV